MICCYLLYSRQFQTADEALHYYAQRRTSDAKGVTIPSQRRYVEYYATLLRSNETYQPVQLYICEIRLTGTVNIREGTINVSGEAPKVLPEFRRNEDGGGGGGQSPYTMQAKMDYCMPLSGDVKIELLKNSVLRKEKRCHFWFNTYFVERAARKDTEGNLLLTLSKTEIDDAHKDKHHKEYPNNFTVELVLRRVPNGKYSESVSLKKCHPPVGVVTNSSLIWNNRQVPQLQQQQQPPPQSLQHQLQQTHPYQHPAVHRQVASDPYRAAIIKQQNSYNDGTLSGGGGVGGYLHQQPLNALPVQQNNHNHNHHQQQPPPLHQQQQQQQQYQQPVHDHLDENNHHHHHLEYSGTSSSESSTEEEGWDSGECPTQLLESPEKANLLYYRNDNYYYGSCNSPSGVPSASSASLPNPTVPAATTTTTTISTVNSSNIAESTSNRSSSSSGKLSHNTVSSSNINQQTLAAASNRSSVKPAVVVPAESVPHSSPLAKFQRNGKLPSSAVEPLTCSAVACPTSSSSFTSANVSAWPSIGLRRKKKKSFKAGSARSFALSTSSSGASTTGQSKSGKGRFQTFRWLKSMRGDPNLKKVLATSGDIVTLTSARSDPEPTPVPSTPPPTPTVATFPAADLFLPSSSENLLSLDYYSSICDKQLSFESPCKSPGHLMKLNLSRRPPPTESDCPVVVAKPSEQRLKIGFDVSPSPSPTSPTANNPFVVITASETPETTTASAIPPKSHNLVPRSENASFCDRILQTFVAGISPRKSSVEHTELQVPPGTGSSSSTHNSPLVSRVSRCSSFSLRELGQELKSVIKAQPQAKPPPPDETASAAKKKASGAD